MLCPLEIIEMALSVLKKYLSYFTKKLSKHLKPCHITELASMHHCAKAGSYTYHFFTKR